MRLLLLLLSVSSAAADTCASGTNWTTTTLSDAISFVAQHKVVGTTLHLRLQATTTGWLGFGFAERTTGHMKGADMMTAHVADNTVTVDDRYATFVASAGAENNGDQMFESGGLTASLDTHNDWTIVSGSESDGVTSVYATRALSTGDTQDRVVSLTEPTRIVWAYGAAGDVVAYHGATRGTTEIHFGGGSIPSLPAYDGSWTRRVSNYNIRSSYHTTYACESFSLPTDKTRHAIAFRPIFSADTRKHVHHIFLHTCTNNAYWQTHQNTPQACNSGSSASHAVPAPGEPGSSPFGDTTKGCNGMLWGWASGQGDFIAPADAGFKIDSTTASIIMEIHYDNPGLLSNVIDDVGVQIFYTESLRANDAGWMLIGDVQVALGSSPSSLPTSSTQMGQLTAGQSELHRQGACPGECTSLFDGTDAMHIFALFHHMHYTGERMYLEHYDSSGNLITTREKEKVDFWDNGFQTLLYYNSDEPFTVNQGDSLHTHCFFNTARSSSTIEFGQGTPQEMCIHIVAYYPIMKKGGTEVATCGLKNKGSTPSAVSTQCGPDELAEPSSGTYQRWRTAPARSGFGTANQQAAASATASQCTAPTFDTTVSFTITVAGDVATYNTAAVKAAIALSAATALGVLPSQITVTVTAASVLIALAIATTASGATEITTSLTTHLASNTAAATLISANLPTGVNITVESVTQPTTSSPFPIVAVVVPIAAVVGLMLIAGIGIVIARRRGRGKKKSAKTQPGPSGATDQVEA